MEKSNPEDRGRDLQSGALIRLRGIYPSLKAALQKVACLILSQPEMAIYASVNEVAAAARVSEATVMRFWRILGYKGFQDFKISLARELVVPPPRLPEDGVPTALVRWIFKANLAALEETLPRLLSGGDLIREFHLEPGPRFRDLLTAVQEAQWEGMVRTREEALGLVRRLLG